MNTDDYKGHTPGPWYHHMDDYVEALDLDVPLSVCTLAEGEHKEANARLIAAAPKLRAEVKRLQKEIERWIGLIDDGRIKDVQSCAEEMRWELFDPVFCDECETTHTYGIYFHHKDVGSSYDDEGFRLSDGGTICWPDRDCDGKITRIDYWGNTMDARYPEDDNYEMWNKLFQGTEYYYTGDEEE